MTRNQLIDGARYNRATGRVTELSAALAQANEAEWLGLAIDLCLTRARQAEALSYVLRGTLWPESFEQAVREAVQALAV